MATNQSLIITCMSSECSLPGTCNHWLKLSKCMVRLHSVNTFPQLLMISNIEFSRNNLKFGKFDYRIWIKGKKLKQNFQIKTITFALQISKLEFTANTYLMFINFYLWLWFICILFMLRIKGYKYLGNYT